MYICYLLETVVHCILACAHSNKFNYLYTELLRIGLARESSPKRYVMTTLALPFPGYLPIRSAFVNLYYQTLIVFLDIRTATLSRSSTLWSD